MSNVPPLPSGIEITQFNTCSELHVGLSWSCMHYRLCINGVHSEAECYCKAECCCEQSQPLHTWPRPPLQRLASASVHFPDYKYGSHTNNANIFSGSSVETLPMPNRCPWKDVFGRSSMAVYDAAIVFSSARHPKQAPLFADRPRARQIGGGSTPTDFVSRARLELVALV